MPKRVMIQKTVKVISKLILTLSILVMNFFINQIDTVDRTIANANIDGGFIILLIIGFSYGGYKLYRNENA